MNPCWNSDRLWLIHEADEMSIKEKVLLFKESNRARAEIIWSLSLDPRQSEHFNEARQWAPSFSASAHCYATVKKDWSNLASRRGPIDFDSLLIFVRSRERDSYQSLANKQRMSDLDPLTSLFAHMNRLALSLSTITDLRVIAFVEKPTCSFGLFEDNQYR